MTTLLCILFGFIIGYSAHLFWDIVVAVRRHRREED